MTAYLVIDDTSVRVSADPESEDFERWIHYPAGSTVTDVPKHADVKGWVASGHWIVTKPKRKAKVSA